MEIKETAEKNVKFARASFREAKRGANFVKTNLSSLNMGNDKNFLIRVVSQCLPYIGYPRSLNAINCINKAVEE